MTRVDYAVFLGLDVGKEAHHVSGLDPGVHDKAVAQDETTLRAPCERLSSEEASWSWLTSRP